MKKLSRMIEASFTPGHAWIINQEMVRELSILNDALLELKPVTGIKERVPKLLLQIPFCELHNHLLKSMEEGELLKAHDQNGIALISNTALWLMILLEQLHRATEGHKQMCGCKFCRTT
jgi:hypothetical protein